MEALRYIKRLKEEHDEISKLPGFMAWTSFVHKYTGNTKDNYVLIKDFPPLKGLDDSIQGT